MFREYLFLKPKQNRRVDWVVTFPKLFPKLKGYLLLNRESRLSGRLGTECVQPCDLTCRLALVIFKHSGFSNYTICLVCAHKFWLSILNPKFPSLISKREGQ